MNDKEIRILRYHMTSGYVLATIVDDAMSHVGDDELLSGVADVLVEPVPFITITEITADSRVLVRKASIDFVQVAHAERLFSEEEITEAAGAEESAIRRAARAWKQEGDSSVG